MKSPTRFFSRTFLGVDIDLTNIAQNMDKIHLLDIAHHLASSSRYNGACPKYYSVGQHSLLVAKILPSQKQFAGLLHDATETYCGDIIKPLKNLLPQFQDVEAEFEKIIAQRFNLNFLHDKDIKIADCMVMAREMHDLLAWQDILEYPLAPVEICNMSVEEVRREFVLQALVLSPYTDIEEVYELKCYIESKEFEQDLIYPKNRLGIAKQIDRVIGVRNIMDIGMGLSFS